MHRLLPFHSLPLPGHQPWLARRLAWLVGAGLLCCLLGLLMGAAAVWPVAAEPAGAPLMTAHAGAAATVAVVGSEPVMPVCARLPAHGLCIDAESGDSTDPATLPMVRLLLPALHAVSGQTAPPTALAQATLQPLLRPPRGQG